MYAFIELHTSRSQDLVGFILLFFQWSSYLYLYFQVVFPFSIIPSTASAVYEWVCLPPTRSRLRYSRLSIQMFQAQNLPLLLRLSRKLSISFTVQVSCSSPSLECFLVYLTQLLVYIQMKALNYKSKFNCSLGDLF